MTDGPPVASEPSALDQVEILRPLPQNLKAQLEARLTERLVKAGQVVFGEGDPGDAMYLIVAGEVSVYLTDKALGLSCELARLGAGQVFGEMALITGSPRSASVRAVDDVQLRVLSREILFKLVQAAPQVGLMIAAVLAKRTEELNKSQWLEFGSLKGRSFDPLLADLIPAALVKRHRVAPVARVHGVVTIATPDPSNRLGIEDVRSLLPGERVRVLAVSEADFNAWVQAHLSGAGPRAPQKPHVGALVKQTTFFSSSESAEDAKASQATAASQDIALLATTLIVEGVDRGASDIHIEPEKKGLVVRYRVDGQMVAREGIIPRSTHAPLLSRLKVLGGLNITERRLPQDGRLSFEIAGKPYDARLSTVNAKYGEKVVLRILDSSAIAQDLSALILADKVAQVVRKLFQQPNGLVLVAGPTGSGKTTTLYAALRERMSQPLSVYTVEDPVEYDLPGVTQVQVNEAQGLGFPEVLRAFLRQNPDVIFVGEMRDAVTAKIACQAALTGHLVLSSLHTNDALSTVARLAGMEVEPFVLASSLLGVLSQRLVRRICANCRTEAAPNETVLENLRAAGVPLDPSTKLYKGKRCALCNGEGFKGRVGVFELLVASQRVKDAIARGADVAELRRAAQDGSYVPMSRYAAFLLGQGLVEPADVLRILPRGQEA